MRAARAYAPQGVHCAWPAVAKVCGAQGAQTVLFVVVQAAVGAEPAAHCVQLAHGELPEALHVERATQDCTARHESVGTSQ
jgi:hypothetical protein